jgi:hypothetical protein
MSRKKGAEISLFLKNLDKSHNFLDITKNSIICQFERLSIGFLVLKFFFHFQTFLSFIANIANFLPSLFSTQGNRNERPPNPLDHEGHPGAAPLPDAQSPYSG